MCVRLFLEGGTRIKWRVHKSIRNLLFFRGIREYENKSVEGRDINLEYGSASPLSRKGRGSHPVQGPGLKKRNEQREKVGAIPCGCRVVCSRIKTFVSNHLLDPDFFLGGRRMNFHKTIGFLASLLLIVGLGVPDSFAQRIDLSVSPRTLRDSTTTPVTVTATLTVQLGAAVTTATGEDVSVNITGTADDSYTLSDNTGLSVNIPEGEQSRTMRFPIVFTFATGPPQGDADYEDETITLTAAATINTESVTSGTRSPTITITDYEASLARDARSIRGTRVIIATPAAGAWASTGNGKIRVRVLRKGHLAAEFGAFTSIRVSLRQRTEKGDDDEVAEDLYNVDITDAVKLGSLIIPRNRTAVLESDAQQTGAVSGNSVNPGNTEAHYTRRASGDGYDILEFRFHLTGGGEYEKVYARVTFGLSTDAPDGTETMINSYDTETSIFPQGNLADKVGDGKFINVDAGLPSNAIISTIAVEIDGEAVDNDGTGDAATLGVYAGIGDKIKISVTTAGFDFPETTLGFQIIGRDAASVDVEGTPTNFVNPLQPLVGFTKTFGALEVIGATSQRLPVEHEFTVAANQFERKLNVNHPTDSDRKKNSLYEDDNTIVQVRAFVRDRAGNSMNQTALSSAFVLDSRPPKVTITYPKPSGTDSTRFTAAATQEYEFIGTGAESIDLKPLNFKNDESTTQNYVIIGTDTLMVAGNEAGALAEVAGGYNLTDADTYALKNLKTADDKDNKRPEADSKQPGAAVKLQVVSMDLAGNKGTGTPDGGDAIFDAKAPVITIGFPTAKALEELDGKIGGAEQTQHPVFSINEATDSILVRYEGSGAVLSVAGTAADEAMVNKNIQVMFLGDNALRQGESYNLQVYARDLAGQVGISDLEEGLMFDNNLQNPAAAGFKIYSHVRNNMLDKKEQNDVAYGVDEDGDLATGQMDSIVAGQPLRLTIVAIDDQLDRTAITYNKAGVKVVTMDSDGNLVVSANYWGDGVTNNGDGSATLDGTGWSIGKRTVFVNSNMAGGPYNIVVKDLTADGVVNFMSTLEGITVDAADFAKFTLSAWEDGVGVAATSVWGDFDLLVVPTDRYGNASLKTYLNKNPATKKTADSLAILDTRVGGNKYASVDANFASTLTEDLPLTWSVQAAGESFPARALDRPGRTARIRVTVDNNFLKETDDRSRNISGDLNLLIQEPLDLSITLWVPGQDGDQAGNDVVIPADPGEVTVTARAEGFNEGDMVTFTKDGTAMDPVTADADGYADLMITMSAAGSVTVSAASGQYSSDPLTITFVEGPDEPMRMAYADADGNPVYLVDMMDNTVDLMDYMLFRAAWGMSASDDINGDGMVDATDAQIFLQSDINGDGMVGLADYEMLIMSWGKTAANGPATKPLVLAPGVNENAEFSLSLGSERVIAGEMVAVDVSLANVAALMGYGFTLNYDTDKFEFVSVAPADEDLLKSTGGETPLFHNVAGDGQVEVVNGMVNGSAVSGGGDIVRFVFRVLYEFEDNARFEIANGLVFDPTNLTNPAVVAGVLELQSTPREFALHQNFPNPFNPDTTIKYELAESADVTLQIYNVLGQVVRTLVASEAQNAGRYQIRWNGMDDRGVPVSSGVYFYQISAEGKFHNVRKLMLLK